MSQLDNNNDGEKQDDEDIIQSTIGNFGRWQFRISALMALLKFPIAWIQMSIVFLAPPTQFWCKSSENSSIVWSRMMQETSLLQHEGLNSGFCQDQNGTMCQNGYEYNRTIFNETIVTEWNLVCENKRFVDISQITLMFGVLLGNIIFGVFADRQGRKKTLIICIVLQSIFGVASAQIPWFWGFVTARFLMAVANGGTIVTSFVMCMEIVGGSWRSIVPILYQIPYGFGNSIMAGLAYFFWNWRDLQLALSLLSSVYIFYFWFIPESPRWLLAIGKKDEALKILQNAASMNKINPKECQIEYLLNNLKNKRKTTKNDNSYPALFANRELIKRNILLCINWLIAGVTFYAFSQYVGKVGSNLFLTVIISGFVALPGTLLCVFVIRRYGRRWTIALAHLLTAICFFGILAIPVGVYQHDWPRVITAGLGIVGLSISMPALYLFTGELFPTTIRNAGVGLSVMCSRLGSMIAPLVITMQDISPSLPLIILGIGALVEAILILPLPETKGLPLPETIDDLCIRRTDPEEGADANTETNPRCYISLPQILRDENRF